MSKTTHCDSQSSQLAVVIQWRIKREAGGSNRPFWHATRFLLRPAQVKLTLLHGSRSSFFAICMEPPVFVLRRRACELPVLSQCHCGRFCCGPRVRPRPQAFVDRIASRPSLRFVQKIHWLLGSQAWPLSITIGACSFGFCIQIT